MPLTPNFTVTQPLGSPSEATVTDTSTGSDASVVTRRVYFQTAYGNFLVEEGTSTEYESFPNFPSLTSIDYELFYSDNAKDFALTVTVEWLDNSSAVLYSLTKKYGLTSFSEEWDYQLTQMLSGNPLLINDAQFYQTKDDLRTNIDSGNQAVYFEDMFAAQQCYDRATNLRLNSPYYTPAAS